MYCPCRNRRPGGATATPISERGKILKNLILLIHIMMVVYTHVFWGKKSILNVAFTPKCSWNELWPRPYTTVGNFRKNYVCQNTSWLVCTLMLFDPRNRLPMFILLQNVHGVSYGHTHIWPWEILNKLIYHNKPSHYTLIHSYLQSN